ncbi:hypothetical protein MMC14_007409 [Varicellaria rhodocarpa]|nr:hypothetical protein [Varicellaria rhodocarpa]
MIKTVIYIKAGRVIYKKRKHLDGFLNPFKDNPFNMVVTEVEITRQDRFMESTHQGGLISDSNFEEYSVDVKAQKPSRYDQPLTAILQMRSLSKKVAENEANAEAWLYARSAFLYYIACFIIWTPATVSRIYTYVHPNNPAFGYNFTTAFFVTLLGTFNCIVYCITSKAACRSLYWNIRKGTWTWDDSVTARDKYETQDFHSTRKRSLWSTDNSDSSSLGKALKLFTMNKFDGKTKSLRALLGQLVQRGLQWVAQYEKPRSVCDGANEFNYRRQ